MLLIVVVRGLLGDNFMYLNLELVDFLAKAVILFPDFSQNCSEDVPFITQGLYLLSQMRIHFL